MKLSMIGSSHHRTPVNLRERLAFMPTQVDSALLQLRSQFPHSEFVLLSTCNRVEIYAASMVEEKSPTTDQLKEFILGFHELPKQTFIEHLSGCSDAKAIEHLFTVASSLDSLVVGESQILSQVKDAYESARHLNCAGPIVHAAFQRASHVAKRVTNETEIHAKRVSIPSVAVSEVARDFFEHFNDKHIVVIGSGEMGTETIRYLQAAGATQVHLINRSTDKAKQLIDDLNIEFDGKPTLHLVPWEQLFAHLEIADLIVSTTSAAQPIVTRSEYERIIAKRKKKSPQLILDLAVPRDFEESVGSLPNVYVYTVDDLQAVCERNISFRKKQFPIAIAIIKDETDRFMADARFWQSGPTIKALQELTAQIKSTEYERLLGRLERHAVPAEVHAEIEATLDRLVNKLLNTPLQSLRQESESGNGTDLLLAFRKLFQIER
jgi:glutamyl-tRNA reductase